MALRILSRRLWHALGFSSNSFAEPNIYVQPPVPVPKSSVSDPVFFPGSSVAEPEPVGAGTFLVGAGAGVKM